MNITQSVGLMAVVACTSLGMLQTTTAKAEMRKHETRFSITYGGIEIGKARFKINFNDESYSLEGDGATTGLVEWLVPATGNVTSTGSVIKDKLSPKKHFASYKEKKKSTESVEMAFANETVTDVKIKSAKKRKVRKAPSYVPIEAKHKSKVLDPASPLVVPVNGKDARSGRKVCDKVFPIFDGETRYDIKLRYKSTKPIKTEGYEGFAHACKMEYIPVAGHKITNRQVKEMAENSKMEIWLAPMTGVSVFTPIKIIVGTKYGRFVAKPDYFGNPAS